MGQAEGPRMVDVTGKPVTARSARAQGKVRMRPETLDLILSGKVPKGDVLATARLAAIQAAKRTWEWIPLCHPIPLTGVEVRFETEEGAEAAWVRIEVGVRAEAKTGVEMEALTAVAAAALTLYDMCKGVDQGMVLEEILLLEKRGGKTDWKREEG